MHIPDGILPPAVSISAYGITGGITWFCLRQISKQSNYQEQIPKASLLTATFFVSSLIHIPLPPFSIHLILNGLIGLVLGYFAFPAILIGLFFQAVFFQHGGLSSLGINALIMGIPSLVAYYLWTWRKLAFFDNPINQNILTFLIGSIALFLSALFFVFITLNTISSEFNIDTEKTAILTSLIGYGIQAVIEGVITLMLVNFLDRVKPEIISN